MEVRCVLTSRPPVLPVEEAFAETYWGRLVNCCSERHLNQSHTRRSSRDARSEACRRCVGDVQSGKCWQRQRR
jgi:hypothetical protein